MINADLEVAYKQTAYKVYNNQDNYVIRIDELNDFFSAFCHQLNITNWAVITAYNPYSKECLPEENDMNNLRLKAVLEEMGLTVLEADGVPADSNWDIEKSYFVYNLSLDIAKIIGKQFEQNAIVYGEYGKEARLVWC